MSTGPLPSSFPSNGVSVGVGLLLVQLQHVVLHRQLVQLELSRLLGQLEGLHLVLSLGLVGEHLGLGLVFGQAGQARTGFVLEEPSFLDLEQPVVVVMRSLSLMAESGLINYLHGLHICHAGLCTVPDFKCRRKRDTALVVIQVCILVATQAGVAILAYRVDDDSAIEESWHLG